MDALTDIKYKWLKDKCDKSQVSEADCQRLTEAHIKYLGEPEKSQLEFNRVVDELASKYNFQRKGTKEKSH